MKQNPKGGHGKQLPADVLAAIDDFYAQPQKTDERGETQDIGCTALQPNEARALAGLVLQVKPLRTLEIGLAAGGSCIAICAARRNLGLTHRHIALDPFQKTWRWGSLGLLELSRVGLREMVEWLPEKSEDFLPNACRKGARYDFVFDDGAKSIGESVINAFYIDQLLNPGGVAAFHDGLIYPKSVALGHLIFERNYEVLPIGPDSYRKALLRMVRYSKPLGLRYAFRVIPRMFRSIVALRKPAEPSRS